jgi:hypothetical protein
MTVTGSGNFAYTRTLTGATNVTLPTTGTLSTLAGTETLTNKTLTGAAMNGTVGATTPSTVAATTISASGTLTANGGFNQGNAGSGARAAFSGNNVSGISGANVEIGHDATTGTITSYNRTTSAYKALNIDALSMNIAVSSFINLQVSGSTIAAVSSTGLAVTGALSTTGAITPSQTAGIVGTTTNNSANAGSVGEYVTATLASGSAHTMTATVTDATISISLTAGDWDVTGNAWFVVNATSSYYFWAGISVSSTGNPGTIGGIDSNFISAGAPYPASANYSTLTIPVVRVSLASTTTVYILTQSNFVGSANTCFGTIRARRVR